MMNFKTQYPLSYELIKTEIASKCSDLSIVDCVMGNTPGYVLDAFEHHLQGEQ